MYKVKQVQDISVVGVDGELERENMRDFENLLDSLSMRNQRNIVLNLENLKHLDYKLVQSIADRIIEFQCDGGDLKMANANRYVRQIMQAFGLEEEMYASVEDALLSFLGSSHEGDLQ
ncbi:MAG: STAS domain-containing protein [Pseudomonadota bacterium]